MTERSILRVMCEARLKNRKRCTDLMFMLLLDETLISCLRQAVFAGMAIVSGW